MSAGLIETETPGTCLGRWAALYAEERSDLTLTVV